MKLQVKNKKKETKSVGLGDPALTHAAVVKK